MNMQPKFIYFVLTFLAIQVIGTGGELGNPEVLQKNVEPESSNSTNTLTSDSEKSELLNSVTDAIVTPENEKDDSKTVTSDSEEFSEFLDASEVETKNASDTSLSKSANVTTANSTTINFTKVNCLEDKVFGPVEIVNYTRLMELLLLDAAPNRTRNTKEDKALPGTCILVMFYAKWCVFSSQAAPHFNAIPRFYPHLKVVAIDAMKYQNFNTQYGIVGVPTLMLVHNAKPVAKFNETVYTLETFSKFVSHLTNLKPNESLYVTSADFSGPVSCVPTKETDYCLVLSWVFIIACLFYFTMQSAWWKQFIESVQNTWRESNAQHEHVD